MPPRKFFYGDIVRFRRVDNSGMLLWRYENHVGHMATVVSTKILSGYKDRGGNARWPRVTYTVACECGRTMQPQSTFLGLIRREYEASPIPSPDQQRLLNFLNRFPGDEPHNNGVRIAATAEERIEDLISNLEEKEKFILTTRHGLAGSGGKSFREIGESLNLSGERIRQIEQRAIGKLHAS
jgi:hypothetical protein